MCSNEMSRMSTNKESELVTSMERRMNYTCIKLSTHSQSYWTLNMPGVESFKRRKAHLKVAVT